MDVYGIDSSDIRCGDHPASKRDMRSVRPSLKTLSSCSQFSVKVLLETGKRSGILKPRPPCVPFLPAEEPEGIDCQVEWLEMHSLHGLDGKTFRPIVAFTKELQCQMKIVACDERAMDRMIAEPANFLTPAFFETTDSMSTRWASLEKLEMQAILKIIVGEEDLDYFDQFVSEWTSAGGDIITEEVNEAIQK